MNNLIITHPEESEYASYYRNYVSLVDGDINSALKKQITESVKMLSGIAEEKGGFRYEEGKWSIKELVGHMIDSERVMAYRAMRISRGDKTPSAGFDQDLFIENSDFNSASLSDLIEEFELVRRSNILMFAGLDENAWMRTGVANDSICSTRALAYIIAGHELHHMGILEERYLD